MENRNIIEQICDQYALGNKRESRELFRRLRKRVGDVKATSLLYEQADMYLSDSGLYQKLRSITEVDL